MNASLKAICSPALTAVWPEIPRRSAMSMSITVCSATETALHPLLLHTKMPFSRAASMSMALKATPSE